MAAQSGLFGLGTLGTFAVGGAIAIVVGLGLYWADLLPEPETAPEQAVALQTPVPSGAVPAEPSEPDTSVDTTADVPQAPAEAAQPVEDTAGTAPTDDDTTLSAPSFDVVRAAPDGTTVIAGQAEPGSVVTVLIDNDAKTEVTADPSGDFVAFLTLDTSAAARALRLSAQLDDQTALSEADIILAPTLPAQTAPTLADPAPADEALAIAPTSTPPPAPGTAATSTPDEDTAAVAVADPAPVMPDSQSSSDSAEDASGTPGTTPAAPPDAVAVLRSDADGVELIQPATPAPAPLRDEIALDTISYSTEGEVLLTGRARGDSLIRVYIDNAPVADLTSAPDGRWRGTLGGVDPGIYILRLDELNTSGGVVSRLETPFKREAPATLARLENDVAPEAGPVRSVTVQTGDTLWAISRDRYGDGLLYVRVFEANRDAIRDPDLIYPGQIFAFPD